MSFEEIMNVYFRGERLEGFVFIGPLGALCLLFGIATLVGERSEFSWGISIPFVLMGLVLFGTGLGVGLRTSGQVTQLATLYHSNLGSFIAQELPRMQIVNSKWPQYLMAWSGFVGFGLSLRFLVHREWALGLGTALLFFGGVGFMIDGFAERRAKPYTAALETLAARSTNAE
jgi:hypothetical protein